MISIGRTLKYLRRIHGLSQEQLALGAHLDRRYLSDLENDRRNPSLKILENIATYFGFPLSSLIKLAECNSQGIETIEQLKDYLIELELEDTIILESPPYLTAILGISETGQVIYGYEEMIADLIQNDGMSSEEAADFIDYNTIRAIPYMGKKCPIILYRHLS